MKSRNKLLTTKQVRARLKRINPSIEILGEYLNAVSPLLCQCLKCKHKWSPLWTSLNRGCGCPQCHKRIPLTTEVVRERLKRINPKIKIIGKYRNHSSPLHCRCLTCEHEWSPTWNKLQLGRGCPRCGRKRVESFHRLTLKQVIDALREINPSIKILDKEYRNALTPIKCKCTLCNHTWHPMWVNLRKGHGCPICNSSLKSEREVRECVEKLTGWKFPKARPPFLKGFGKSPLELDGFNEKHKVAFEYQGQLHYMVANIKGKKGTPSDLVRIRRNDDRKRHLCRYHGVKLISIPYWIKDVEAFLRKQFARLEIKI